MKKPITALLACTIFSLVGCTGAEGPPGPRGAAGAPGPRGEPGEPGEPGKDADSIDGSRLAARYIVGDDGSRQPLGDWLDVETDMTCRFLKYGDDLRCVPDDGGYSAFFSDSDCTQAVLVIGSSTVPPPPPYGTSVSGALVAFKSGDKIAQPEALYEQHVECEQATFNCGASGCGYFAATLLPPGFFVSGAIEPGAN